MSAGRAISLWDMRYPAAFTYNPNSNRDSASQHAQLNMKLAQVVVKFTSSLSSTGTGTLSQIWLPSISEDGSVVLGTQVCTVPPSGMPRDTLLSSDFKVLLRFSCMRSPGAFTLLICTDLSMLLHHSGLPYCAGGSILSVWDSGPAGTVQMHILPLQVHHRCDRPKQHGGWASRR